MADGNGLVSGGHDGVVKCWDVSSLGIVQSGGEPVGTKILKYEGHRVCLILFSILFATYVPFFSAGTLSLPWLFLPVLDGLPPVSSTEQRLLSGIPTAPYHNAL